MHRGAASADRSVLYGLTVISNRCLHAVTLHTIGVHAVLITSGAAAPVPADMAAASEMLQLRVPDNSTLKAML